MQLEDQSLEDLKPKHFRRYDAGTGIECMHATSTNQAVLSDLMLRITLLRFAEAIMSEPRAFKPPLPATGTDSAADQAALTQTPAESGGRGGLDPTRYGDWEKNGRCIDF
jgi:hypothetical protein